MSAKPRYVIDTTVLVSAALFKDSKPGRALRAALKRGDILLSPPTLDEINAVLNREKFDQYLTPSEREEFLEALIGRAVFIEPDLSIQACRDFKDDKFIELAVSGQASVIVSGDQDLLVLHSFQDIAIVTPDEFLAMDASTPEEPV